MSTLRENTENNSGNTTPQAVICCSIIKAMQKDALILHRELLKLAPLEEQYKEYLKEFLQFTQLIDSKLYALWTMPLQFVSGNNAKPKEFVQTVTAMWKTGDEEIRKTLKNTQLVSQNNPDIPLEELIHATRHHFFGLKKHLDMIPRHTRCNYMAYSKNNEIMHLLNHLSQMDYILQYYIALCRINPFLHNIGQLIDQFIIQEGFLVAIYGPTFAKRIQPGVNFWKSPASGLSCLSQQESELSACQPLSKLLTGELLGNEPLDPQTGLEPMVKDSKLEVYLVPSASVKISDKTLTWKRLFDVSHPGLNKSIVSVKTFDPADNNTAINYSKQAFTRSENIGTKDRIIHAIKLPYKGPSVQWKNRKQKFRDIIGSPGDTDLQPIKIPRIEGALLPPLP